MSTAVVESAQPVPLDAVAGYGDGGVTMADIEGVYMRSITANDLSRG